MSGTLRQEILNILTRGVSLYRVGKDSGVSYPALHRFVVHEQAASMHALDKLCDYCGLQPTPMSKAKEGQDTQR